MSEIVTDGGLREYKKFAIKAAKDLRYPRDVEDQIKEANSMGEVERIMISAREEYWRDKD